MLQPILLAAKLASIENTCHLFDSWAAKSLVHNTSCCYKGCPHQGPQVEVAAFFITHMELAVPGAAVAPQLTPTGRMQVLNSRSSQSRSRISHEQRQSAACTSPFPSTPSRIAVLVVVMQPLGMQRLQN